MTFVIPKNWVATERSSKCVIIEQTAMGLKMMNNPILLLLIRIHANIILKPMKIIKS
jgi:hypothetical protein